MYAYIFRPKADSTVFEFIADADAVNPFHEIDVDDNGKIDPLEEVTWPGRAYDVSHIAVLREHQYSQVTATDRPYEDQWGAVLTGYAPIRNKGGEVVALLGVDIAVDEIGNLTRETFRPVSVFLGILILFIVIRILVIYPHFINIKSIN